MSLRSCLLAACGLLPCLAIGALWRVQPGPGTPLRSAIAAAAPCDTLLIGPGRYAEGNILIDKPLTVIGVGEPQLDGEGLHEVLTLQADGISLSGLVVQNSGRLSTLDVAGIKVLSCSEVSIRRNRVLNCNFGIYLSNVQDSEVAENEVIGNPAEEMNTGNGIHLWKCERIALRRNRSLRHRDGIYFEFVTASSVEENHSESNIRYGLHFMFSHNDTYLRNCFRRNGSGVAVMYSHHVQMGQNSFEENWGAASYGLLLKDISDSHIWGNRFASNTAAAYLEGSNRIVMEHNEFSQNGWALRVQASCTDNEVRDNHFSGNTFDVATNGHLSLNRFSRNYWDHYEGYDLGGDGTGDLPYYPVSLFSMIAEQMPPALLFVRSFAVYLLERMEKWIPSLTPAQLSDQQPRMRPDALPRAAGAPFLSPSLPSQ
jgi:nitrous oxidase accessory protein